MLYHKYHKYQNNSFAVYWVFISLLRIGVARRDIVVLQFTLMSANTQHTISQYTSICRCVSKTQLLWSGFSVWLISNELSCDKVPGFRHFVDPNLQYPANSRIFVFVEKRYNYRVFVAITNLHLYVTHNSSTNRSLIKKKLLWNGIFVWQSCPAIKLLSSLPQFTDFRKP